MKHPIRSPLPPSRIDSTKPYMEQVEGSKEFAEEYEKMRDALLGYQSNNTEDGDDEKWVKNAKGEIIGYENTRTMTLEEFKELYG